MKISPIYNQTYHQNFKSGYADYFPIGRGQYLSQYKDEIVNSHETYFFRNDINWIAFKDYLIERFSNCPKIDTIVYGCSDGSEPYSLSMLLQSMIDNPERFFPIRAFDLYDDVIIKNIKDKNSFKLEDSDFSKVASLYETSAVDISPYIFQDEYLKHYCTNKTTEPVEFKQGNIITDIDRINFNNPTLFMCRNMWPYVSPGEYYSFSKKLYSEIPSGSSVIIGDFDYKGNRYLGTNGFPNFLLQAGFKHANSNISRDIPIRNLAFEKD